MTYNANVAEIIATLRASGDLDSLLSETLSIDLVESILTEAARFAAEQIAPLNAIADRNGPRLTDGVVTTSPGWPALYADWRTSGWNALSAPEAWGGQQLPGVVQAACREIWNAASMSFGIGPTLTEGAIEALIHHAPDELKQTYLPRLVSGEWMGTMNLTEPQSGSDLSGIRSRAEPAEDGTYRVFGQKIFITYGEHDLAENIVHLVLARLPDAPEGTRGISLFLVPKFLVNPDGTLGERNDLVCAGLEHKLGLHGSPTCTMQFGETNGAIGYLIGEENRGLNCMFTMMNNTRLAVGIQGVGIAERAYQQARTFAGERRQGRADPAVRQSSLILAHPDVQRMLMTMKAMTAAARGICYKAAAAIDRSEHAGDEAGRRRALAVASLLTPIAKAFSTDTGVDVASLGIQVHGGMGYIEETGAAQHYRDARIAPIYEGTNGIQAIDLVTRKIGQEDGAVVEVLIAGMEDVLAATPSGDNTEILAEAVATLRATTRHLLDGLANGRRDDVLASATPYLRLFALTLGGIELLKATHLADDETKARWRLLSRFFDTTLASTVPSLGLSILKGTAMTPAEAAIALG
ncbi:acyl-CoA dehydrogenase [Kaistia terrae]|uniref:Acyl-CoA dehydrogenase n=1 Tax=Kaistia terrae TaxID=537017 RepID=A0ABW0PQL4_9HYPH|nr:acyl-CoA dehydrogenase [Kaistia terrae]MCX5577680.1 acyl-CoA dehydrogenase [Kaistia terrae]